MLGNRPLLLLAISLAVISAHPYKTCRKNSDCKEDECCVTAPMMRSNCQPIGKEADYCLTKEYARLQQNKYFLRCPCVKGLECVTTEGKYPGGKESFLNAQCLKKEE